MIQKELVHDCVIKRVPIPALETFEDRTRFPTRYFIFFDSFVGMGRHNRVIWKKAIQHLNGENSIRFGPAIFEAHVRTTIRENYFKWIFQQLIDIDVITDEDFDEFKMEYDEEVYTKLPDALVCTTKGTTKFPFKKCEVYYGEPVSPPVSPPPEENSTTYAFNYGHGRQPEPTNDSGGDSSTENRDEQLASDAPNPASPSDTSTATPHNQRKEFFIVLQGDRCFNTIRKRQRKEIAAVIARHREDHENILKSFRDTIQKIRDLRKSNPETEAEAKAIAEAKKNLRLFKDPEGGETERPAKKKYRKSMDNQTRYSDSKMAYFSAANDNMKKQEEQGLRKAWEVLYKKIWNKYILPPKEPDLQIPVLSVQKNCRDMEADVSQMMVDAGFNLDDGGEEDEI